MLRRLYCPVFCLFLGSLHIILFISLMLSVRKMVSGISKEEPKRISLETENVTEEEITGGWHILLVEDNDLNAEIAQTLLEDHGFQITRACDGKIKMRVHKKFTKIISTPY